MQRLFGTLRLFQMPSLKRTCVFLILMLVAACGSEQKSSASKELEEQLPKVNKADFRIVRSEEYQMSIPKTMSVRRVSGNAIFNASYLPKEEHILVSRTPISRFRKDESFPGEKKEQLEWFAKRKEDFWRCRLSEVRIGKLQKNKQTCFFQKIEGKEYGFPKEKCYYLRYYKIEDNFITITCWTSLENASKFEKTAQYMGMTFALH